MKELAHKLRKVLLSFPGAMNQLNELFPKLAFIQNNFEEGCKVEQEKQHEKAFLEINKQLEEVTQLTHFERQKNWNNL